MRHRLTGWRIVLGSFEPDGSLKGIRPLYGHSTAKVQELSPILHTSEGFHVGTKRKFCLSYYTNMVEPTETEAEILLKLEIAPSDVKTGLDRFRRDAYMGSEAIVLRARIVQWQRVDGSRKLSKPVKL